MLNVQRKLTEEILENWRETTVTSVNWNKAATAELNEIFDLAKSALDAGWRPKFVEVLADMVNQHCSYEGNFYLGGDEDCKGPTIHCELDSMALSANASAMRLLAQEGRIKIESEYGRRIGANWIKPLPSPPADKEKP